MGNTTSGSKDRHIDETVDFGSLVPQGVYTGSQDWNQQVVGHLILDRKLAPFYRPLEDYEEDWDDDQILAARKGIPDAASSPPPPLPDLPLVSSSTSASSKFHHHHKNSNKTGKEPFRPTEASVYKGAVECPICFLYYPPNINKSRCCDQAICTECFVQIKRAEPTTTHLVSEPASCPYCVQENFGVTYSPPPWRTGLMSDAASSAASRPTMQKVNSASSADSEGTRRRRSFSADSPEVVTIDHIRPDWEAKLAAVRAAVTRRANRRIIMRQVGDRLIPIGVTSGRVHPAEGAEGEEGGSGRRSSRRRNHGGQDLNQMLGSVGLGGLGGHDLEELMMMEAMRLSLLEHEEHQRRQTNNSNNNSNGNNEGDPAHASTSANGNDRDVSATPSSSPSPHPSSSPSTGGVPIPIPRAVSPISTPDSGSSPHQGSLRPHLPNAPSPLGNVAVSAPREGSLQPPHLEGRSHRRTGSSPGPASSGALAAALSAAQTASAFLGPSQAAERRVAERPGQGGAPRSAPETRAASPRLPEIRMSVTPPNDDTQQRHDHQHQAAENASATASSLPPASTERVPSEMSISSSSTNVVSVSTTSEEAGFSNGAGNYKPLPSSTEASDPFVNWADSMDRS